nr:hypothetical protein [Tanacetum cinerariifolium]
MADQRTMAELLRAPTEGYAEAIVAWDRYKDLLRACPHHGFTELHQLDTFYNAINLADQDSLNAAAGGNILERRTQDVLMIIENKSKVRNSRNKSVVSQVKSCDANSNSSSEIAKLTHAVNQQTSVVTTAMTAILKKFQETPPPASIKTVEEICVTCGGAHPYYQCLAASGNTFLELRDNIQGYVSAAAVNYNQGNSVYRPPWSGSLPNNIVANPKGKLKTITTRSEETLTDPDLSEYTIKVPHPPVQKYKPPSQIKYVVHQRDPLHPNIPYPSRMLKQKQQEKDDKMLKALLLNKEKLQELANTPLNENCSAVILKKLPGKLRDLGKFLISCGFSELKCKALANLAGMARDVFVPVGKFTFPANFGIVDYESDPRVPLILGRPFLRTARAIIDVHGEEMILHQPSGNPTFSSHPELTSPEVKDDIFDSEGGNVLTKKLLDLDCTKDLHPPLHVNPLSGSTTYSSNPLLEELANKLALITFPSKYDDDLQFDVESDLNEIEFLLHQDIDSSLKDSIDQSNLANPVDNFVDSMPEMFTDEHALDYSSPLIFDEFDDDFLEVKSDTENVYDDPFDSKGEKIKEVDALPSTNNEDKVFNPSILSQVNPFEIITRVVLAISNASLVLEDFDPPFYEPLFFKEVPRSKMLLPFSSENKEKVFKPGIHTSEKVHSSFIPKLSH